MDQKPCKMCRKFVQTYQTSKRCNFFVIQPILEIFDVLKRPASLVFTFRHFCAITVDCSWLWDSNLCMGLWGGAHTDFVKFIIYCPEIGMGGYVSLTLSD